MPDFFAMCTFLVMCFEHVFAVNHNDTVQNDTYQITVYGKGEYAIFVNRSDVYRSHHEIYIGT